MSQFIIQDVLDIKDGNRSKSTGSNFINHTVDILMLKVGRGMRLGVDEGLLTTATVKSIKEHETAKVVVTNNSIYVLNQVG
ncbi:MAG: hypothetical protein ACRCXQ_01270 [Vagococcus fluvialis]